jgi:hypothetical protein
MSLNQIIRGGVVADFGTFDNKLTTIDTYVEAGAVATYAFKTKIFSLSCITKDLKVTILGNYDGGAAYPITVENEFTLTAAAAATVKTITGLYAALQVVVKPSAAGQHGTLSTAFYGVNL